MSGLIVPPYLEGHIQQIISSLDEAAYNKCIQSREMIRPCMLLKPAILQFGDQWVAEYGEVSTSGNTPEEAYLAFDNLWKGIGVRT